MTRRAMLFALVVVAACDADDAMEIEADEDSEEAAPEPRAEDDPALSPECTYVVACERPAQDEKWILVCDFPPLEPWNPWDPGDPDWPPFEPWTPLELEPDLGRISTDIEPQADIPWPPPGCHEESIVVDAVHAVECRNRCDQAGTEDCEDVVTGELWSHYPFNRPDEFIKCMNAGWEPCNSKNDCESF